MSRSSETERIARSFPLLRRSALIIRRIPQKFSFHPLCWLLTSGHPVNSPETELPLFLCHWRTRGGEELALLCHYIFPRCGAPEICASRLFTKPGAAGPRSVSAVFRAGEEISFQHRNNTVSPNTRFPLRRYQDCGFSNAIVTARLSFLIIRFTPSAHPPRRHFSSRPPERLVRRNIARVS